MSTPATAVSSGFLSQSMANWAIGLSIVGIYAVLLYLLLRKKPKITLADVLSTTDFNNAEQCNTIFNRLMTSAQGCGNYAGASLCSACKQGLLKPLCDDPSVSGYCMSRSS